MLLNSQYEIAEKTQTVSALPQYCCPWKFSGELCSICRCGICGSTSGSNRMWRPVSLEFHYCVFVYYYFSVYFYWINLLIYMTVTYTSVFWFAWHVNFSKFYGTKLWECFHSVWVIGHTLSLHLLDFVIFTALEAVIEYSQNAEEVAVKKLTFGEDKLYLRISCYFKLR